VLVEENTESGWYSFKKEEMLFFDILLKNIWRFKNFVIPLLHQKKH